MPAKLSNLTGRREVKQPYRFGAPSIIDGAIAGRALEGHALEPGLEARRFPWRAGPSRALADWLPALEGRKLEPALEGRRLHL